MFDAMTHLPLNFIIFSRWIKITCHGPSGRRNIENAICRFSSLFSMPQDWSRDMMTHRRGIYYWKSIAFEHFLLCSAAPIQNYFWEFSFETSVACSDPIETWQVISHLKCSLECNAFTHSGSVRTHGHLLERLEIITPNVRTQSEVHEH